MLALLNVPVPIYILLESTFIPPIAPDVAVTAPVIVADVAVNAPAGVTLKGADPNVAFPKYIPFESALNILLLDPIDIVPPDSAPVNVPLAEDKAPLNVPDVAVRTPASVTLNGAFALLAKVAPA